MEIIKPPIKDPQTDTDGDTDTPLGLGVSMKRNTRHTLYTRGSCEVQHPKRFSPLKKEQQGKI